jgi:protein SCO1/2
MKNRRKFIAALATTLPFLATAATNTKKKEEVFKSCPSNIKGPMSDRFGQIIVTDQNKKKQWFYEELLNDKLVLVSFTSVRGEKHYPIIGNLVKVQDMLKDRLGKDVLMLTITTNPTKDTPEELKKLADSKGAKWQFLTGDATDIRNLLLSFGIRGSISGLSWVGNEKTGRWMTKASRQHPLFIAEAVARLSTGKAHKPFLVDLRSV